MQGYGFIWHMVWANGQYHRNNCDLLWVQSRFPTVLIAACTPPPFQASWNGFMWTEPPPQGCFFLVLLIQSMTSGHWGMRPSALTPLGRESLASKPCAWRAESLLEPQYKWPLPQPSGLLSYPHDVRLRSHPLNSSILTLIPEAQSAQRLWKGEYWAQKHRAEHRAQSMAWRSGTRISHTSQQAIRNKSHTSTPQNWCNFWVLLIGYNIYALGNIMNIL